METVVLPDYISDNALMQLLESDRIKNKFAISNWPLEITNSCGPNTIKTLPCASEGFYE